MLGDISIADNIYIVTGYTDMRKSIDGLCAIILNQMRTEPDSHTYIMDMGSMNGTFLNNKKIDALVSTLLRVNDLISLGGKQYRFVEES